MCKITPWTLKDKKFLSQYIKADFETGLLYWKEDSPNGRYKAGEKVLAVVSGGSFNPHHVIYVEPGKPLACHAVVWFLSTGEQSLKKLKHIDGDNTNNRLSNLAEIGKTFTPIPAPRKKQPQPRKPTTRQGIFRTFVNPHKFTHYRNGEDTLISGDSLPVALC